MSVVPEPATDERGTMIACPECGNRIEASVPLWIDFDADIVPWVYGLSDLVDVLCSNCGHKPELSDGQLNLLYAFVGRLELLLMAENPR